MSSGTEINWAIIHFSFTLRRNTTLLLRRARFGFWWVLLSAVFGSVIYRIVIAVVLQLGLKSTDLKLLTALIVAIALSVPVAKSKIDRRRRSLPGMNLQDEENTRHVIVRKHADEE